MTPQEAREKLRKTIKHGYKHRDYQRVVDLAKQYKAIITGDGSEDYLKRFVTRESETMFKQRCELTQTVTPAVANIVMKPAYKIPRVMPSVRMIDYDIDITVDEKEKKLNRLMEFVNGFHGDESVDEYIGTKFIDYSGIDPNAYLIMLFEEIDGKNVPYPEIASSKEVINFEYRNDTDLMWLIVKQQIDFELKNGELAHGDKWRIFTGNDIIEYSQVDHEKFPVQQGEASFSTPNGIVLVEKINDKVYIVNEYQPKTGFVPAMCLGTLQDLSTDGRTYVNLFHSAMCYFMKTIKVSSEFDLQMTLHTFLQRFTYRPKCKGEGSVGCNNGTTATGQTCGACGGTGYEKSTSSQEEIQLTMPREPEGLFDLSKLTHYVVLPVDILTFQKDYIKSLSDLVMKTVYTSDVFVKDSIAETATEKIIDMDSVYDTLTPFSKKYSKLWMFMIKAIAVYTGNGNKLIVKHQFPKDFKMKSVSTLLGDLKTANDSNAGSFVKLEISNDLASAMFSDRPIELQKIKGRQMFDPFNGKTHEEIIYIISNNLCTPESKILWGEQNKIFTALEEDGMKARKPYWFYDLAYEQQKVLLEKKVKEFIDAIDAAKPKVEEMKFDIE